MVSERIVVFWLVNEVFLCLILGLKVHPRSSLDSSKCLLSKIFISWLLCSCYDLYIRDPWDFYSAILSEFGLSWGLNLFLCSIISCLFFSAPLAEPDLDLFYLLTSTFFSGRDIVSYSLWAASINSSWSRLIPSSSISTNKGLNTCRRSESREVMSILYAEI